MIATIKEGRFIDIFTIGDVVSLKFYPDSSGGVPVNQFDITITAVNVIDNNFTTVIGGTVAIDLISTYDITSIFWSIEKTSGDNYKYPKRPYETNLANPETTYNPSLTPNSILENNSPIFVTPKSGPTDEYRFLSAFNNYSAEIENEAQNRQYTNSDLDANIFNWRAYNVKMPLPYGMIQRIRESLNGEGVEPYYMVKFINDEGEEKEGWVFEMNYLVSLTDTELLIFEKQ